MASSITNLNSPKLLPISKEQTNPFSHFPSNTLKFASLSSRTFSNVSCSVIRDTSSVLPLQDANGSVVLQRPDSFGRFGKFGGKYVPETLMHALTLLEASFHSLAGDEDFQVLRKKLSFLIL